MQRKSSNLKEEINYKRSNKKILGFDINPMPWLYNQQQLMGLCIVAGPSSNTTCPKVRLGMRPYQGQARPQHTSNINTVLSILGACAKTLGFIAQQTLVVSKAKASNPCGVALTQERRKGTRLEPSPSYVIVVQGWAQARSYKASENLMGLGPF